LPRMIDLIRNTQVPANLMQSAARGALSVPAGEMIEILVYLTLHHKVFGEQASLTLASWDEKACIVAAGDPRTSPEVLGYFVSLENMRTHLLPALAENPSVTEDSLLQLAVSGSRSVVEALFASARVKSSPGLLQVLQSNPNMQPEELAEIGRKLYPLEEQPAAAEVKENEVDATDPVVDETVTRYLQENAEELAAEKDKPFQPIGMVGESGGPSSGEGKSPPTEDHGDVVKSDAEKAAAAAHAKKHAPVHEVKRDSTLQKIAKLDVKGRIALAVRGSKEERSILIRDGTKLVALAVLESPKVSDGEVENFAQQKNVLESVLRAIPMKRRFAKNYNVVRNLVFNPRTPLDLSLGLMKNLLIHDLKNLSGNKEVAETIRKLALRMFKQKMEKKD